MWISLNWIKDFVDYQDDLTPNELGVLISLRVAEVEDVKICGEALSQVRVAEVTKTEPHPDADKLKLATLFDGSETRTIVCGAANCRPGIKIPFADIGAKFNYTNKEGKPAVLEIKPTKIRGVESTGMLCSQSELGLADSSDGIWELPADMELGKKLSELDEFKSVNDVLFEIDNKSLTHRPDLWGHYGLAREFSAIYNLPLKEISGADLNGSGSSDFKVVNSAETCRRYSGLEVRNVKVAPSPQWMQDRLTSVGMNTINNLVDITNYILLELGQPMHAFDVEKLGDKTITVRSGKAGEVFKALDEKDYELTEEDLVIDNNGEAVALAGVMGGLDSGVSDSTTHLFLESANFDAATVRRTSTRCGLRSDSSARFEKSLDPENTVIAMARAVELIKETCPEAEIVGTVIDSYEKPYEKLSIDTSIEFLQKRLGTTDITEEFIREKLTSLGFGLEGNLNISIPTWRATKDVSIAEDIVEEVGRMYGYDNIKPY
ncbi:MAG: phenylalanine--tRNA ligase subunit beta, partial [Lentisphaeraceae bacterium]|nr:phenylalanine--tRNA ligase subunit beta [Lentisphaeraceae bacterium]